MSRSRVRGRARFLSGSLAVMAAGWWSRAPLAAANARPGPWCVDLSKAARENAFDFSLNVLDGHDAVFTLSELVGLPVWLQFFTSWCPPCNAEAADLVRIATKYADEIHVIGISVREKPEPVRAFRERHKIPYPIALDDTGAVFKAFGFTGYPTHMFLDADGFASCISVGDLTPAQMENEIAVARARERRLPQARG